MEITATEHQEDQYILFKNESKDFNHLISDCEGKLAEVEGTCKHLSSMVEEYKQQADLIRFLLEDDPDDEQSEEEEPIPAEEPMEADKEVVKRPMASRRTSQITCTMDHEHREYLKSLAVRLANERGEPVNKSQALRYLFEKIEQSSEDSEEKLELEESINDSIPRGERGDFIKVTVTMPPTMFADIKKLGIERGLEGNKNKDVSSIVREAIQLLIKTDKQGIQEDFDELIKLENTCQISCAVDKEQSEEEESIPEIDKKRTKITFMLDEDIAEWVRDAIWWTPGITLSSFIQKSITRSILELEQSAGKRFPSRRGGEVKRPIQTASQKLQREF